MEHAHETHYGGPDMSSPQRWMSTVKDTALRGDEATGSAARKRRQQWPRESKSQLKKPAAAFIVDLAYRFRRRPTSCRVRVTGRHLRAGVLLSSGRCAALPSTASGGDPPAIKARTVFCVRPFRTREPCFRAVVYNATVRRGRYASLVYCGGFVFFLDGQRFYGP